MLRKITFDEIFISFVRDTCLSKYAADTRSWSRTIGETEMTVGVGKLGINGATIIGVARMTIDKEIEIRANREPKPLHKIADLLITGT